MALPEVRVVTRCGEINFHADDVNRLQANTLHHCAHLFERSGFVSAGEDGDASVQRCWQVPVGISFVGAWEGRQQ